MECESGLGIREWAAADAARAVADKELAMKECERERQLTAEAEVAAASAKSDLEAQATTLQSNSAALAQCQALLDRAKTDGNTQARELSSMTRERDDLAAQLRRATEKLEHSSEQATALQDDLSVMQRAAAQRKDELLHRDARIRDLEQEAHVLARKSRTLEQLTETLKSELEQKDIAVDEMVHLKLDAEEHASSVTAARQHDLNEIDVLKKEINDLCAQLAGAAQKGRERLVFIGTCLVTTAPLGVFT